MLTRIRAKLRCSPRRPRRGSVYVFVLGVGTLLGATAVAAVLACQIDTRSSAQDNDAAEAGVLAESAVEYALQKMATTSAWRTVYTNNVETTPVTLGRGTISFKFVDELDGNLANNVLDPVRVYGIARVAKATRVFSVKCGPTPVTSLKTAMSLGGFINFGTGYTISGSATISSNGSITGTSTDLGNTNLEAAGTISLVLPVNGGYRKSNQRPKELPDPTRLFDYYNTNGTRMTNLPISGGALSINRVLISPTNNPFSGGTHALGIYVIDCAGSQVNITSARIVGTLVLLNCGGVTLQTQLNWEPAVTGYPALLVQGNLTWKTNTSTLSENSGGNVNFNPAGSPYPYNFGAGGGASNTTTNDSYPTQIVGIVYCSGQLDTSSSPILKRGVAIAGGNWSPNASSTIDLTYDSSYFANPAPGFLSPILAPVSKTWRRETAP